MLDNK